MHPPVLDELADRVAHEAPRHAVELAHALHEALRLLKGQFLAMRLELSQPVALEQPELVL